MPISNKQKQKYRIGLKVKQGVDDLIVKHQAIKQASVAFNKGNITMIHFSPGLMETVRLYLLQR